MVRSSDWSSSTLQRKAFSRKRPVLETKVQVVHALKFANRYIKDLDAPSLSSDILDIICNVVINSKIILTKISSKLGRGF